MQKLNQSRWWSQFKQSIKAVRHLVDFIISIKEEWNRLQYGGSVWQKDGVVSTAGADGTDGADVFRWLQVFWRDFLWLRAVRYDHPSPTGDVKQLQLFN